MRGAGASAGPRGSPCRGTEDPENQFMFEQNSLQSEGLHWLSVTTCLCCCAAASPVGGLGAVMLGRQKKKEMTLTPI